MQNSMNVIILHRTGQNYENDIATIDTKSPIIEDLFSKSVK